jgi:RDD family
MLTGRRAMVITVPFGGAPRLEPVTRWTGSWIGGSPEQGSPAPSDGAERYPGQRLGLPAEGAGSVAGFGRRAGAFVLDMLLSSLVAAAFTAPELPRNWSVLAWALLTVVPTAAFGMTPGMTLFGLRVARLDGATFVGVPRALLRTALLFLVVPAVVTNTDRQGLHDRAVGVVVLRTR